MWKFAFSLASKYWQVLAVAALIGVVWLRVSYITGERDEALANLQTLAEAIRDNAIKAEAEKALLAKQGEAQRKVDQAEFVKNSQIIANAYYSMVRDAQNETQQIKIDSAKSAAAFDEQLRKQAAVIASRSVSYDDAIRAARADSNATVSGSDETGAEHYRVAFIGAAEDLRLCRAHGASCAKTFNECRAYVLGEQSRIGVSQP
jgi:hypothetical protein